jgi:pimeloyl-ACP methyl ester carboxylesterase
VKIPTVGLYSASEELMNLNDLESHRRTATTEVGDISYLEVGEGPVALFVHGVFTNAVFWRNVLGTVGSLRRCIAVDLPAHGETRTSESWDLSLPGLARSLAALCDAIDLDRVDLVANDTGGAVAQIFAATNPQRLRSFTLTNCDTQGNTPPSGFAPVVELARKGELAEAVKNLATDFDLARSEAAFGSGYERPQDLPDEVLNAYLAPLAETDQRARELERCVAQIEAGPLLAVEPQLKELDTPTLLVWGTGDPFFTHADAEWLRDTIPGVTDLVEIEGAKLFFPDERAAEFAPHLLHHWNTLDK